ncbi:MAG TPA: Gfo/Idh/MocA family oxidoreductase [Verrucomicrobiae bacterium]|nr:Gfo/Idh/MocA family oxidoreductase [Verrucomicrobiae bacterium]
MSKPVVSSSKTAITRRQFIYYSALAATSTALTGYARPKPRRVSPNDKLNIAVIGCGGKGSSDLHWCSSENIVALCDVVDGDAAAAARNNHPDAKFYKDFRELLEKEKSVDAVDIAVPDHMHAPIAAMAIKMGKHVYCQKPLTHDVFEARTLRDLARKYKVATQMGNQGSASDGLRRAVEVVQAGLIGPVHQAYVWTNRPIWPQGLDRPPGSDPVPANLDWDLWLGTAPLRPYKAYWPDSDPAAGGRRRRRGVYEPFVWRGWQDFGTGALGDMACHTVNWPFRALNLGYPTEIEAESSGMNKEMYPKSSRIRFEFPAREGMPPVTFHWSDGGNKPPTDVTAPIVALQDEVSGSGCLMIGEKGMVFSPDDGDQDLNFFVKLNDEKELVRGNNHEAVKAIPQTLPRNACAGSPDQRQHLEWIAACKGGTPGYSNFDIAAYLTEIILLGCVALRVGKKLEWDGPHMRAKNAPEAAQYVRRHYRNGWTL